MFCGRLVNRSLARIPLPPLHTVFMSSSVPTHSRKKGRQQCPISLSISNSTLPEATFHDHPKDYEAILSALQSRQGYKYIESAAAEFSTHLPSAKKYHFMDPKLHPSLFRFDYFVREDGRVLDGLVMFNEKAEGFPGCVHGGVSSALLDDALGFLGFYTIKALVTTELDVRFLNLVKLQTVHYLYVEAVPAVDAHRYDPLYPPSLSSSSSSSSSSCAVSEPERSKKDADGGGKPKVEYGFMGKKPLFLGGLVDPFGLECIWARGRFLDIRHKASKPIHHPSKL
ncbi:mitochondrial PaaI thioesterase domain-containing protein thioesterase [Andalucia godoyi]|uniref:Mitochondrial PaaI thioesterase domain-containing protein thioesterase n=1 Tax=Andalucia godoyi TaxID=505711 RepID=A0A8K0F4C0_ANDGO|nr:mitochondrial PaaI thioesterase domain-containing protein thioesterase [Andalucia godoyi]|eukprot:ANDGO_07779.mRNA.1 mitochondrial PaaI thioesterase domain-containing protein thioesterase